jgi:hypothetical protein
MHSPTLIRGRRAKLAIVAASESSLIIGDRDL